MSNKSEDTKVKYVDVDLDKIMKAMNAEFVPINPEDNKVSQKDNDVKDNIEK